MDLSTLETFLAVAKHQSFSVAAEHVFMTQPAVSKRIANLEQKVGSRLFDRVGHKITLTASGRLMAEHAKTIVQQIHFAQQALQNLQGRPEGPLQIATGHHIGFHRLPAVIKVLAKDFPDIHPDIRFMDSEEAYQGIREGELECALLTLPEHPLPQVVTYPIWRDELVLVAANDHPLASAATIDIKQLQSFPVILPEKHTFTRRQITQHFEQQGLTLPLVKTGDYLETIKVLVECGLGWSVLPRSLSNPNLTQLHLPGFQLARWLGLTHHEKRPLSSAATTFLKYLMRTKTNDK
ncbi:MAG: LysR family transcriptional regulator [Gammaproteobacteria bacterium]|nr:LysR family transcriptional regulator [Gammaproteobacteria bacterium]NVK87246.1 LysR family transcriptional regulator [Gammaproteobacteria bacterium]